MGQESLTRFDQPKKKKTNKNQSQQWKIDRLAKIKLSQTTKTSKYHPSGASEKKPAITRKPIIITKNEAKK
jgi:response regulator of citrate/malate metabolism